jgi:hypothetical protein
VAGSETSVAVPVAEGTETVLDAGHGGRDHRHDWGGGEAREGARGEAEQEGGAGIGGGRELAPGPGRSGTHAE